jgi:hypothetical protein
MNRRLFASGLIVGLIALDARPAAAGMPSANLTDLGAMRFEAISFFALGLILCAAFIQVLWNWLRRDFPRLPRLSYGKACAIVALWGLLFVIVLTMISGARELMTPGAWKKDGATYKLTTQANQAISAEIEPQRKDKIVASRREKLHELGAALTKYAKAHDGQFPATTTDGGLSAKLWQLPGDLEMQYKYVPGATTATKSFLVAYEPNVFEGQAFALFADGRVAAMDFDEILASLPTGGAQ